MHKHKILALADKIEQSSTFNMNMWWHDPKDPNQRMDEHWCATPACIAGHHHTPAQYYASACNHEELFAQDLDIPLYDANEICCPVAAYAFSASALQAAWLLRNYVETGEVDWRQALTK